MELIHQHTFWTFVAGLFLGMLGIGFLSLRFLDAKKEIRRLKRHLSDKLELESEATNRLRVDLQEYKQQNENLRIKVANLNQMPDRRLQRELEIFARAERWMVSSSPGFPAIWEEAKRNAVGELEQEEDGQSLSRRVFNALLNRPASPSTSTSTKAIENVRDGAQG
jgi:hypothetical protein